MTPEQRGLVRELLLNVRFGFHDVEAALAELELILRGEVTPTIPDQGATLPGPPPPDTASPSTSGRSWWRPWRRAARRSPQ